MKAAAFLLCVLIMLPVREAISGGDSEHSEWSGTFSPYQNFSAKVIRETDSWSKLWAELGRPPPQGFQAGRHIALAVFLGLRRTGGYDLAKRSAQLNPGGERWRRRARQCGIGRGAEATPRRHRLSSLSPRNAEADRHLVRSDGGRHA